MGWANHSSTFFRVRVRVRHCDTGSSDWCSVTESKSFHDVGGPRLFDYRYAQFWFIVLLLNTIAQTFQSLLQINIA